MLTAPVKPKHNRAIETKNEKRGFKMIDLAAVLKLKYNEVKHGAFDLNVKAKYLVANNLDYMEVSSGTLTVEFDDMAYPYVVLRDFTDRIHTRIATFEGYSEDGMAIYKGVSN